MRFIPLNKRFLWVPIFTVPALVMATDFMSLEEFEEEVYRAGANARERDNHFDESKVKELYRSLSKQTEEKGEGAASRVTTDTHSVNPSKQSKQSNHVAPGGNGRPERPRSVLDNWSEGNGNPPSNRANAQSEAPNGSENTSHTYNESTANHARRANRNAERTYVKPKPNLNDTVYIAPPLLVTNDSRTTFNAHSGGRKFGIKINTWMDVSLRRPVSSADVGSAELILESPFIGDYDYLPADTIFMADPVFNGGNQRVDFKIFMVVLPSGEQIEAVATAYDLNGRAGILGHIVRDRESEVADAAGQAAVQMSKSVLTSITPNNIVGSGVDTFSDSMIDNEDENRRKKKEPVSVVSPQQLRIKLERGI